MLYRRNKIWYPYLPFSLAQMVKILMALAIYLTYSLMLYVPAEIMWPHLSPRFHTARAKRIGEYAFRAILVLVTCKCCFCVFVLHKLYIYTQKSFVFSAYITVLIFQIIQKSYCSQFYISYFWIVFQISVDHRSRGFW